MCTIIAAVHEYEANVHDHRSRLAAHEYEVSAYEANVHDHRSRLAAHEYEVSAHVHVYDHRRSV